MAPYVQTREASNAVSGATTIVADLKVSARRTTTTITARRISQIRLSRVDSLMSLLIRSSEITPYSRMDCSLNMLLMSFAYLCLSSLSTSPLISMSQSVLLALGVGFPVPLSSQSQTGE